MSEQSMRAAYGEALVKLGTANSRIVALDADTSASTLANSFAQQFPERFFNIGIAEPCMVDVAVGLALEGMVPFVNAFSALLAVRALEQIRTCICYAGVNVKLAASYAGLSDFKDGATHYAITDIANMRALPGMTVIVPADAAWEEINISDNLNADLREIFKQKYDSSSSNNRTCKTGKRNETRTRKRKRTKFR